MKTLPAILLGVVAIASTVATTPAAEPTPASKPAIPIPTTKLTPENAASDGDFFIGPDYAQAPELREKRGVPAGRVKTLTFESKDSDRYPGISKTKPGVVPYTRKVGVYIPHEYDGRPAPFIVCQDAMDQREIPTILDNMIAERRLPVMLAVFISNGGGDGKGSERGLEYDTVSGAYAEFVEAEILPKVASDANVVFTKDPDARATMGCSSGAAAAFTMAWFHPDLYRRVLSYSGTYVNQQSPENPASPHGAWEYHEHLIPDGMVRPLRVWLEVGEEDNHSSDEVATYHNWVLANVRMAEALKQKGYHYQFVFAKGARHCDGRVTHQTLPGALEWLWQGYAGR